MYRAFIASLALNIAAFAACNPADFQFHKDVQPPESPGVIGSVSLDADICAVAQADFRDVRLIDRAGGEVPFRIERGVIMRSRTERVPQSVKVLALAELSNNVLEIEIELPSTKPAADVLTLATPLKDFERSVSVFASNDRKDWRLLIERALVFDYTRFMDVHNHDVALPRQATCRYLKLVIGDVTDDVRSSLRNVSRETRAGQLAQETESLAVERRAFRVDNVTAWRNEKVQITDAGESIEYPVQSWSVTNGAAPGETVIEIAVRRPPLTSLVLDIPDVNFSRMVEVYTPAPAHAPIGTPQWLPLRSATISRFRIGGFAQDNVRIEFPEQRSDRYRIVIRNLDNPPLQISGVHGWGNVYRAQFLSAKDQQYSVLYGSASTHVPQYDIAALQAGLARGVKPVPWSLGAQIATSKTPAVPGKMPAWLTTRVALGCAIGLMVAVLAVIIWYTSKRVGSTLN